MSDAEKLRRMAGIVERRWSVGGTGAGMSLDGVPGDPCAEDAAAMVGYSIGKLRRAGLGHRWNDRQRSGAAVGAALRRAAARKEGCAQKPERVSRQHMSAAPALGSAVALLLLSTLVVAIIRAAWALVTPMLAELVRLLVAVGEAVGITATAAGVAYGAYRVTRVRRARRVHRAAIERARAEITAPIALPYVAPTTTNDALLRDWTQPHEPECPKVPAARYAPEKEGPTT